MFKDISLDELESVMKKAWDAFAVYRNISLQKRAAFMKAIAVELEACGDALLHTAMEETHLPEARLRGERTRTIFQLNSYADACARGEWMEISIDTAIAGKVPPKPDLRKTKTALGPVVVFGASNFPFAYSTAGGDTACALAAGCPVIVKAHPAHSRTSEMVAGAVLKAVKNSGMPDAVFAHLHGAAQSIGEALVKHPYTKAVGFTGSYGGGRQLFDWGNQRKDPIPVFAEMGSVNPVFLLQEKMKDDAADVAKMYAGSITLGVGQFCTNPGIIIGIKGDDLDKFMTALSEEIKKIPAAKMLHEGIAKSFAEKKESATSQTGVKTIIEIENNDPANNAAPVINFTSGSNFIANPKLHEEVFGPYSIIVACADMNEMTNVAKNLEGQLSATLMATEQDIIDNKELLEAVKNICGRFIINNVPTGVEVCLSMHHGGPFPATTDSRFTSVGADGIKRFARPIVYQNWPDNLLPDELKHSNPLNVWRTINDVPGKA
ncbi:MAG: aldehyde dehydrogenase (NADP(+)) [Rhizobacter sp.]|nr:aldehyde dehydrogenase (NADP(+)) [Ferruginibacter sp.]